MTASAIASSIAKTKVEEKRHRQEPAQLVVCLVIAMSLWSKDSMRDLLKNLIDGLNEAWVKIGNNWRILCKSAITKPQQRLGAGVLRQLFHQLARPMPTREIIGAFINKLRIVEIDGTCLDIPHIDEKSRVFGRERKSSGYKSRISLHLD